MLNYHFVHSYFIAKPSVALTIWIGESKRRLLHTLRIAYQYVRAKNFEFK